MIDQALEIGATGLSGGVGFFAARQVFVMLFERWDKREAHIDATTRELIEHLRTQVAALVASENELRERVDHTETALRECLSKHIASEGEIARLTALVGKG